MMRSWFRIHLRKRSCSSALRRGGEEKPLRVIQGPKTLMGGGMDTDNVEIDPIHNEVYTTQRSSDSILAFSSRANGDVAPIRILHGPKTQLRYPRRVTVDPINNLLAVISAQGILIFNRTDNGDVAPHCIISGPKTGLPRLDVAQGSKVMLNPDAKKIIFGGGRRRVPKGQERPKPFTAIWNYGDCGNVPHLYKMEGGSASFALIPEDKEIIMTGSDTIRVFYMPEAF